MKVIKNLLVVFAILTSTNAYTQYLHTDAGSLSTIGGYSGDNRLAKDAVFNGCYEPAFDNNGNMFIPDAGNNMVRKLNINTGIVNRYCGDQNRAQGYAGDGGNPINATLTSPTKLVFDATGNLFIAETYRIRKINMQTNKITTFAGTGNSVYNGDNISATSANLTKPIDMVFDNNNNLYFADLGMARVRKIDANGIITTVAGNGSFALSGLGGLAVNAEIGHVRSLTFDPVRNCLYVASSQNTTAPNGSIIMKIDLGSSGTITKFSGDYYTTAIYGSGDGGAAINALYYGVCRVNYFNNNLYVSDYLDKRLRIINLNNGNLITTLAGSGSDRINDGIAPLTANVVPNGVTQNLCGNLVISDGHCFREIFPIPTGVIHHAKDYGTSNYTPIKNVDMGVYRQWYWNSSVTTPPTQIFNGNNTGRYFLQSYYPDNAFFGGVGLVPNKNNDVNLLNGISLADVKAIQDHISGTKYFNNAFKCIAADVDNNGVINSTDVLRLKRFIQGLPFNATTTPTTWFPGNSVFTGGRLWAFVGLDQYHPFQPFNGNVIGNNTPFFSNPNWYNNYKYPGCGNIIQTDGYNSCNESSFDFYGVKLGDVDWDWNPSLARANPIQIYFNDIDATELDNVTIPVRANNFSDISGVQFSLSFDPTHFEYYAFENDQLAFEINSTQASTESNKGVISFIWVNDASSGVTLNDGSVLFYLTLHKKKSVKTDDIVLTSDLTKVEAINNDLELVPITKKKCKIIDNSVGASENTHESWDILPNYSNMSNLMIKTFVNDATNVTLRVFDKDEQIVFETARSLNAGDNFIYANIRNKMILKQGVYYVKLVGMQDEDSKPFFVGNIDEYAADEDVATGDISVASDNQTLALYSLKAQLYQRLKADASLSVNSTILQTFLTDYASSNFNKIYAIETALTDGNIADANGLVGGFTTTNAVEVNYKKFYGWVIKLINQEEFTVANESDLNALVIQCPLTAGMVVHSSRDLSNSLTEENTMFGDVCPVNNTASRSLNNYVYKPTIITPKPIIRNKQLSSSLISVYPNPTKGLVHISIPRDEKGVWNITVQDVLGRVLQQQTTTALTKNMDIVVSSNTGFYYVTMTNKTTNKKFVEKVIVE